MRRLIYRVCLLAVLFFSAGLVSETEVSAQTPDRREVRSGNRKFRREDFRKAEIDYRKGLVKDSLSLAANYNLANTLYRLEDYDGAQKALETVAGKVDYCSDYYFNAGDVALKKEDYAAAVESFKQSLLINPEDLEAKENYIYAKKKLQDQQNQDQNQNQGGDQNQDQNQDNNQQDQQDQNQDQNQNQDQQDQQQQPQGGQEPKISPQQAQQMLKAIQAKEKDTQDKVNKEKADLLKSKQKEKNW